MKRVIYLGFLVLMVEALWANQNVTLIFGDGEKVIATDSVVKVSGVLRNMMSDLPAGGDKLYIPNITEPVWQLLEPALASIAQGEKGDGVQELLRAQAMSLGTAYSWKLYPPEPYVDDIKKFLQFYVTILNASNYLDIPDLIDAALGGFVLCVRDNYKIFLGNFGDVANFFVLLQPLSLDMQQMIVDRIAAEVSDFKINTNLAFTLKAHNDEINSMAFNSNGTLLATGADDGLVKLWKVAKSGEIQSLAIMGKEDEDNEVNAVAFNNDGTILAAGFADGTVHLWKVSGTKIELLKILEKEERDNGVSAIAFNNDGTVFATGTTHGVVSLWKINDSGRKIERLKRLIEREERVEIVSLAFDATGAILAVALNRLPLITNFITENDTYELRLLSDLSKSEPRTTIISTRPRHQITSVTFNKDVTKKSLCACATYTLQDAAEAMNYDFINNGVSIYAANNNDDWYDPDGPHASYSDDYNGRVYNIEFNAQGTTLAVVTDRELSLERLMRGGSGSYYVQSNFTVYRSDEDDFSDAIAFTPKGDLLAAGLGEGVLKLWNVSLKYTFSMEQALFIYCLKQYVQDTKQKYILPDKVGLLRTLYRSLSEKQLADSKALDYVTVESINDMD